MRAYLIVPLPARGRMLGAITIVSTRPRIYHAAELSLAEEIAQRAGLALENARLYKAAQHAREEAECANRAKDQFLAMLSHELRTPLSPVLSTVALLESEESTPPHIREALQMIQRNVALEARLIDDLLDLTRVSKGKLQLNLEDVDAHALIKSALEICDNEIKEKQLDVTLAANAERHFLRADSARLHQIFWNLIKNAVKFTPPSGRLTLTTENDGVHLHVTISDTGAGIERELLPKIFNAFEQGARPGMGGLGLGLAITHALVQLHGGEIWAESEGRDRGATFNLCFTTADAPAASAATGTGTADGDSPRQTCRLLLVEDHADTQHSLKRLLERRGYEVRAVNDIGSAMTMVRDYPFDVLVSDMGLPDGTGIELMHKLRVDRGVLGIALSGYGMEEDVLRSKEAGFREHLTKPVEINKLDQTIQRLRAAQQNDPGAAQTCAES